MPCAFTYVIFLFAFAAFSALLFCVIFVVYIKINFLYIVIFPSKEGNTKYNFFSLSDIFLKNRFLQ